MRRGGSDIPLELTAIQRGDDGRTRWVIGISGAGRPHDAVEHYGPLQAVPAALRDTWKTARALGKLNSE